MYKIFRRPVCCACVTHNGTFGLQSCGYDINDDDDDDEDDDHYNNNNKNNSLFFLTIQRIMHTVKTETKQEKLKLNKKTRKSRDVEYSVLPPVQ